MPDNTSTTFGRTQIAEAINFLHQLRPNGPWVLTAITPDGPTITNTVHTAAEIESFLKWHNGKRNIYYSVNPTKNNIFKKAAKTDIAAVEFGLADLDPNKDETSEDAKQRYLDELETFEPKPTGTVDSGNGIQCVWRFDPRIDLSRYPLVIDGKGNLDLGPEAKKIVADVEARIEAIMLRLGAKAGTQNIDRILRLPGTINLPNAAKRKAGRVECPTRLISFNGASYGLSAFPLPEQNKPGSPEDGGHHARQDPGAESPEEGKLEQIIRYGESGQFNGDRSSAVWFVICEMLRRGYVDIVIMSTLLDKTNRISDHIYEQKEPGVYAKRQITKAKEKIKPAHVEVLPASQWYGENPAPIPPALIKGVLPQTGVATIGGQSGGGKSSHAIHLATRLIPDCDQQFYIDQYRIKRHGGVLYLVLEGIPSFPLRVTAAFEEVLGKQMKLGERGRLPFAWNSYSPNLFEKGPDALIKIAAREAQKMRLDFGVDLVAVILDTMGLAACYENEDKSAQVLRVLGSHLHRLSDETGALVIDVDHMGKDQDAGLRGTSAKRDAPETILTCLLDRDKRSNRAINHRMQLFKVRDGEEGRIIPYRLKPIDMGRDEDGDLVSTCVIQWEPKREQPKGWRQPPKKKQTDVNLERAIKEVGLPADPDELRAAFYRYHGGSAHAANTAWNRAINNKLELDSHGQFVYPELD
jgi:hypothetical protein